MLLVRLVASPSLAPSSSDALHRRFAADGSLLACVTDAEVGATFVSIKAAGSELHATVKMLAETIGVGAAVGRAFRVELQHPDAGAITDEALRAVAVELHGALRASIHVTRRSVAAGRWSALRPMGWGADGLVLGDSAPTLPFGGSESSGVVIEAGAPTVIAKATLTCGVPIAQMKTIAAACGGATSGLVEAGVYPIGLLRDGMAVFVLELGDPRRTPLHRALTLLEVEGRRFGSRLGLGALLSDAPLELFLDTLAGHMGLPISRGQVIETHLAPVPSR
jgi:hypothetical protein